MPYIDYEVDPKVVVRWLRSRWGGAYQRAWALIRDSLVAGANGAVKAGFLRTAPPDALAHHADHSLMFRGFFESTEAFRLRLLDRWNYHVWRGTRKGLVDALAWAIAGRMRIDPALCNISVIENWQWTRGHFSGTTIPVPATDHRTMWVVIRQPHPFGEDPWYWDDGTRWDERYWGTRNAEADIVDLILRIARHQPGAHARVVEIIVVLSGDIDPSTGEELPGAQVLYWRL